MHLSLLTDGIYPHIMGGMQKHSYYLAKYLARTGIKVDVYHAIPEGQPLPTTPKGFTDEELQNLRFFPVHFPKPSKYPGHYICESYIYSKRIFRKLIQQPQPDFFYIQGFSGWEYLAKRNEFGVWGSIKAGINFHGLNMFQKSATFSETLKQQLFRPFVRINAKNADIQISLGGKLTPLLKNKIPDTRIIEIPIGITREWLIDDITRSLNRIKKFVFIGRYERLKGIEELNTVLQELIEVKQPFEFQFIGPIPKSKRLISNKLIADSTTRILPYSQTPLISYLGPIHDEKKIQQILRDSDVLVCPSWSEGMPTVILEAMASGCAIIASDVGAVSEQVDSANGILIEPGNKKQLKEAMITMLNMNEEKLLEMKQMSVTKIKEKFLWEQVAKRTIEEIGE